MDQCFTFRGGTYGTEFGKAGKLHQVISRFYQVLFHRIEYVSHHITRVFPTVDSS
jgi:hypothetical protein